MGIVTKNHGDACVSRKRVPMKTMCSVAWGKAEGVANEHASVCVTAMHGPAGASKEPALISTLLLSYLALHTCSTCSPCTRQSVMLHFMSARGRVAGAAHPEPHCGACTPVSLPVTRLRVRAQSITSDRAGRHSRQLVRAARRPGGPACHSALPSLRPIPQLNACCLLARASAAPTGSLSHIQCGGLTRTRQRRPPRTCDPTTAPGPRGWRCRGRHRRAGDMTSPS